MAFGALAGLLLGDRRGEEPARQRPQRIPVVRVRVPVREYRQLQAARQGRTVPVVLLPDAGRLGDAPPGP